MRDSVTIPEAQSSDRVVPMIEIFKSYQLSLITKVKQKNAILRASLL